MALEGSTPTRRVAGIREVFRRIRREARTAETSDVIRTLARAYRVNDLLTYASAISYQVLFALIPFVLFALGLLGFLSLQDVWQQDIAPEIKPRVSPAVFTVIDDTTGRILGAKHTFWVTFGAALAVWEISGAMRAVMQVFNRIYEIEDRRPFWQRMRISFALAAVTAVLALLAIAVVQFGPLAVDLLGASGFVVDVVAFAVRWGVAIALMIVLVGILVRFAPDARQPLNWVSFGALLVVFGWIVMTVGFWWYVSHIAQYESIFGSLSVVIVAMTYLYASAIVFLTGVQIDALIRRGIERDRAGS
jgi:membrane protein